MSHLDVQNRRIENGFRLTRVGITGVRKPIIVSRHDKDNHVTAEIDLFVDLPSTQKGSHMSRNVEILTEMIDESVRRKATSLEELAAKICRELLDRHEYASYGEVNMRADYFLEKTTDTGRNSLEPFKLIARATAKRGNELMKLIGVEVEGMTACPCAMETVRTRIAGDSPKMAEAIGDMPMITHNQRNQTTLMIEVPEHVDIEADDLIDVVESSLSSPTYGILKREDEASVVINAHRHPKFVEDVVRDILGKILDRYGQLDDSVHVTVRSESEESIHKHNAFAERITTLGELRAIEDK
ncbi:MAG: GTP cyclohydrolase I FolE2 [Methanobacteriota archaeon]|nr:MAG: GTP cyclohydrolase I FolE2 [Euryarchaeota archaeon]